MFTNKPPLIIDTGDTPQVAIIWLHGLGANGYDFESLVPQINLPNKTIRFVFPHAPSRPVTLNNNMIMPAWFDILGLDRTSVQDEAGIRQAAHYVEQLIAEQLAHGICSKNIFLAGFSQGGCIALHTALRYKKSLAGVIALSTYLPLAETIIAERDNANDAIPIFIAHGSLDQVLSLDYAKVSRDYLQKLNYPVSWHHYVMEHSICQEEISALVKWLQKILS